MLRFATIQRGLCRTGSLIAGI